MAEVILQPEIIAIVEKIVDPNTGETSDLTKFSVIAKTVQPDIEEKTIGDLKIELQSAIQSKADVEQTLGNLVTYWDATILEIQNQIDTVIQKAG